jgi:hypothetical protein
VEENKIFSQTSQIVDNSTTSNHHFFDNSRSIEEENKTKYAEFNKMVKRLKMEKEKKTSMLVPCREYTH